jgi:ketosteroid isomerase-like protein
MNHFSMILAAIISVSLLAFGQEKSQSPVTSSKDETIIRDIEQIYRDAVARQDVAALDRTLADDFVATSSRGEIRNKMQEIDDIKPSPDFVTEGFDLDDIKVRIFDNTAIVTGRSVLKVKYKGQSNTTAFRYTRVYVKRKGSWQAVAQQLTRLPRD